MSGRLIVSALILTPNRSISVRPRSWAKYTMLHVHASTSKSSLRSLSCNIHTPCSHTPFMPSDLARDDSKSLPTGHITTSNDPLIYVKSTVF